MNKIFCCFVLLGVFSVLASSRQLADISVNTEDVNATNIINNLESYNVESDNEVIVVSDVEGAAAQEEVFNVILGELESVSEGEVEWNIVETGVGEYLVAVEEENLVVSEAEDSFAIDSTNTYLFSGLKNAFQRANNTYNNVTNQYNNAKNTYNNLQRLAHPFSNSNNN